MLAGAHYRRMLTDLTKSISRVISLQAGTYAGLGIALALAMTNINSLPPRLRHTMHKIEYHYLFTCMFIVMCGRPICADITFLILLNMYLGGTHRCFPLSRMQCTE